MKRRLSSSVVKHAANCNQITTSPLQPYLSGRSESVRQQSTAGRQWPGHANARSARKVTHIDRVCVSTTRAVIYVPERRLPTEKAVQSGSRFLPKWQSSPSLICLWPTYPRWNIKISRTYITTWVLNSLGLRRQLVGLHPSCDKDETCINIKPVCKSWLNFIQRQVPNLLSLPVLGSNILIWVFK